MVTKVAKIEIRRPLNCEKALFYNFMQDLQHQSFKFANKAITMLWDYQQFDFAYKERFGEYFLKKNAALPSGYKSAGNDILNELKSELSLFASSGKDALIRMVSKKWKQDLKEVLSGSKSIANFKRSLPIELHNKQFMDSKKNVRLFNNDGVYSTIISLFSKEAAIERGLKDGNIELELIVKDNYLKAIVNRVISGEYKLSMSKMQYDQRKKKWFLLLVYSFEVSKTTLDPNKILGVDLGINIPAMCAVSNSFETLSVGNRSEIERFEREVRAKRRELQKSCVWASDGARGHGTKRRTKRLEQIGSRIANFKNTKNHCYSRAIVDFALKNQCGTIQLEDLSGIASNEVLLKQWTYFDLQQKITNKAAEHGIKVIQVSPAYTSQRCNQCGFIHKGMEKADYRATQDKFECANCGHKANADVNAAKNIAMVGIEKIIKEQLHVQERSGKHALNYEV